MPVQKRTTHKVTQDSQPQPSSQPDDVSKKELYAPKTTHYEFGGPLGALLISVGTPLLIYWLAFACSPSQCPPWPLSNFINWNLNGFVNHDFIHYLFSWDAFKLYTLWYAWTIICWAVLPGKYINGLPLRDGSHLQYKINAFSTFLATCVALAIVYFTHGINPFVFIAEQFIPLITSALIVSLILAFLSYAISYRKNEMLAVGGNSPSFIYNWYIGRTLNPKIFGLELKYFNELRPGLILWAILDVALIAKQYVTNGNRVTNGILLSAAFHIWYVVDALFNEPNVLSTMDITTDGFGFMLSMGDLVVVPFSYSYHVYIAAQRPVDVPLWGIALTLLLQMTGYYIFRASNNEKNAFRNGSNPKNLKSIQTQRGTRLLISGWWGLTQHPNYLGDWIMAWGWTVPSLFSSPLGAFYPLFFAGLLIHRQMRDDMMCEIKYGADWAKYKQHVPYKIIPYVY